VEGHAPQDPLTAAAISLPSQRCRYAGKNIVGRDRINFGRQRLMDNVGARRLGGGEGLLPELRFRQRRPEGGGMSR
jgi:hypothetical protein